MWILLMLACDGGWDFATTPGNGGGLQLLPGNNIELAAALTVQSAIVQAGADVTVDWSAATTDLWGDPLEGIDQLVLAQFAAPADEVVRSWVEGPPVEVLSTWTLELDGQVTSALLEPETPLDENPDHTWLLTLTSNPGERSESSTMMVLVPRSTVSDTAVDVVDLSATVALDVDVHSMSPITTSPLGSTHLSWDSIRSDVHGNTFDPMIADELWIGWHDVDRPRDLERRFPGIDVAADELYRLSVQGEFDADLTQAVDATGQAFGRFSRIGVWWVGVGCSTCAIQMPMVMAVVEVQ